MIAGACNGPAAAWLPAGWVGGAGSPHISVYWFLLGVSALCVAAALFQLARTRWQSLRLTGAALRQELQDVESRWQSVFDAVPDLLAVIDCTHRIQRVNAAMAARLGCQPAEVIGRTCHSLLHCADLPLAECPHVHTLLDGGVHRLEQHLATLGGDFLVTTCPLRDRAGQMTGSVHVAHDVTEYKRLAATLQAARAELEVRVEVRTRELAERLAFEHLLADLSSSFSGLSAQDVTTRIGEGVVSIGDVLNVDRCAFLEVGANSAEVLAVHTRPASGLAPLDRVITREGNPWLFGLVSSGTVVRLANLLGASTQTPRVSAPNSLGLHATVCVPLFAGGVLRYALYVGALHVEREWPDDLVRSLILLGEVFCNALQRTAAESDLQRTRDEMAHVDRVLHMGQLTTALAHEINQPLAAILCNAQAAIRLLAVESPDLTEVREALRDIVADGKRAGAVVQGSRDMLRKRPAQRAPVDLNALVTGMIDLVRSEVVLCKARITLDLATWLPPVMGDAVQLQQVLLNLMVNALDAMRGQSDRPRVLRLCTRLCDEDWVELRVQDSGPGIAPGDLETVFEPFFTTKLHGMGMGLAINRHIVTSHGGRLWAENEPGQGAVFLLTLPILRLPAEERTP